jgi:hypothetical protein
LNSCGTHKQGSRATNQQQKTDKRTNKQTKTHLIPTVECLDLVYGKEGLLNGAEVKRVNSMKHQDPQTPSDVIEDHLNKSGQIRTVDIILNDRETPKEKKHADKPSLTFQ